MISEFRFRGPGGGNDEFVEIYNNTRRRDRHQRLHAARLEQRRHQQHARDGPAEHDCFPREAHYLFVNTAAAGYSGTVPGNTSYATGMTDDGGIALVDSLTAPSSIRSASERRLALQGGRDASRRLTTNIDRSYERKPGGLPALAAGHRRQRHDFQLTAPSNPQNIVLVRRRR